MGRTDTRAANASLESLTPARVGWNLKAEFKQQC